MLSLDMFDNIVQATLRFQTKSALDRFTTVFIMLVDLLLFVALGKQLLNLSVFIHVLKSLRHIRLFTRRIKIVLTCIVASTALFTKL